MKKIIFTLALLLIAMPAAADVTIICVADPCEDNCGWVTVSYDDGGGELIRGFALDISTGSDVKIIDVNDNVNDDYTIYPGSVNIDPQGNIVDDGQAVAAGDDPGVCGGLDSNCITIEMGSLYVGEDNEPEKSGVLLRFKVDGDCTLSIGGNALRGNIVLEDVSEAGIISAGCEVACHLCNYAGTKPLQWALQGNPESWCCTNQPNGDGNGDGKVSIFDLIGVKGAWGGTYAGGAPYSCKADNNHDGKVSIFDLIKVKANWGANYGFTCASEGLDPTDCGTP